MASPFQGDDEDAFGAARDEEGNIKQTGLARTAKLSNFGAAFNAARQAGEKTFMFKGKKYTTEMAKPKPKVDADNPISKKEFLGMEKKALAKEKNAQVQRESGSFKKGGMVKSSASKRADGCATKGKTRGRMV
jgi:hypothetical protein